MFSLPRICSNTVQHHIASNTRIINRDYLLGNFIYIYVFIFITTMSLSNSIHFHKINSQQIIFEHNSLANGVANVSQVLEKAYETPEQFAMTLNVLLSKTQL